MSKTKILAFSVGRSDFDRYFPILEELRKIEPKLKDDVLKVFNLNNSINSKKSYGGTSFDNIKKMIMKYK